MGHRANQERLGIIACVIISHNFEQNWREMTHTIKDKDDTDENNIVGSMVAGGGDDSEDDSGEGWWEARKRENKQKGKIHT